MPDLYMVRPNWPGPFHRMVRLPDGTPTKKMFVFKPGVPVKVTARSLGSIAKDIAKGALVPVTVDEKGRPHVIRNPKPEAEPVDQPDVETGHGE